MPFRLSLFFVAAALSVAGCYSPNYGDVAFQCGSEGECPAGYECRQDDRCWRIGVPDAATARADATPPVDSQDASPPADASCTDEQILVNEWFDEGKVGWTEISSGDFEIVWSDEDIAHSVPRFAYLAGYDGAVDLLYQDVEIPANAQNLRLSGFLRVVGDDADDTFEIQLRDTSDGVLETLLTSSGSEGEDSWSEFIVTPAGSYQGQTIRLSFLGTTDSASVTHLLVDTLAFELEVCQ